LQFVEPLGVIEPEKGACAMLADEVFGFWPFIPFRAADLGELGDFFFETHARQERVHAPGDFVFCFVHRISFAVFYVLTRNRKTRKKDEPRTFLWSTLFFGTSYFW
jgi:hypothetical protein